MKVLLTALNAKYVHSSLAIRDLKAYCENICSIVVKDYTVNEELQNIIADIYNAQPDIVGFSCYIWNIENTLKIAEVLKKVLPHLKIVFGGPEVSYNSQEYMDKYKFIDAIICGEGEAALKELLEALINKSPLENIFGLTYRQEEKTFVNPARISYISLDSIPFPYTAEELELLENKLVYYESSRGCAFKCTYCLSGADGNVRYLSPERVEQDIKKLVDSGIRQVKFVDRTFNLNKKHALQVWKSILNNYKPHINFHFEIAADLLDDEMLDFLATVPSGLFQFEIGVQSTNAQTLALIKRKNDFTKIRTNVKQLIKENNIHLHLDLIAGLPNEDVNTFAKSFDEVYGLQPHHLQVGFLKVLPGTEISKHYTEFGIESATFPPYEVFKTSTLSYPELLKLKEIENIIEEYYNSGLFQYIFKYIFTKIEDRAFSFYNQFVKFQMAKDTKQSSLFYRAKYIYDFINYCWPGDTVLQKNLLILDLLSNQKTFSLPEWLDFNKDTIKQFSVNKLKEEEFIISFLPSYKDTNWRFLIKNLLIIPLDATIMQLLNHSEKAGIAIFDYTKTDRVNGRILVQLID